ncbi:MAG TPA: hypothetical protein VKX16_12185 [Chloroflexota bacterium]|nr:hypothetical protein [Chloroflexota bacterium]
MNTSQETVGRGSFPLDNLCYDLLTIIQAKSQGLEAYDKYLKDAQGDDEIKNLLQQIRQQDSQWVQQLMEQLVRVHQGHPVGSSSGR